MNVTADNNRRSTNSTFHPVNYLFEKVSAFFSSKKNPTRLQISDQLIKELTHSHKKLHGTCMPKSLFAVQSDISTNTVYIIPSRMLSVRTIEEANALIHTIQPVAVVSQTNPRILGLLLLQNEYSRPSTFLPQDVLAHHGSLNAREKDPKNENTLAVKPSDDQTVRSQTQIPTTVLGVLTDSFSNRRSVEECQLMATDEAIQAIFGTPFLSHLRDPHRAAVETQSKHFFVVTGEEGEGEGSTDQFVGSSEMKSALLSVQNSKLQAKKSVMLDSLSSEESILGGTEDDESHPFVGRMMEFLKLYGDAMGGMPEMIAAIDEAQACLSSVSEGKEVLRNSMSSLWIFRFAEELLRIDGVKRAREHAHSIPTQPKKQKMQVQQLQDSSVVDVESLQRMPQQEQNGVLTVEAIRSIVDNSSGSVVAILDVETVPGFLKHWGTGVSTQVSQFAQSSLIDSCDYLEPSDSSNVNATNSLNRFRLSSTELLIPSKEESEKEENETGKARLNPIVTPVVVGFGAMAAFWAAFVQGGPLGYVSAATKFMGVKYFPTAWKGATMIARSASLSSIKAAIPAKVLAIGPAKSAVTGKAAAAVAGGKTSSSSGAVALQTLARTVDSLAHRLSRRALFGILKSRQGPGGRVTVFQQVMAGVTLTACGGLIINRESIERTAVMVPNAGSVARLGRGLASLREFGKALHADREFWRERNAAVDYAFWGSSN